MPDLWNYLAQEKMLLNEYAMDWPGIQRRRWRHQYADIEIKLLQEFNKSLQSAPFVELQGYVTRVGGRKFILRPGLAFDEGVLCDAESSRYMPADHEFVELTGYRTMAKAGKSFVSNEIIIENVKQSRLSIDALKQEMGITEAAEALLNRNFDIPIQLSKDLVVSLTSSPADLFRIGGLTTTLLPLEDRFISSQVALLNYVTNMLPDDLTSKTSIEITVENTGKFEITPFPWDVMNGNSSSFQKGKETMLSRQNSQKGLSELSIGIAAETLAPKIIDEVWIKYSDLPSFISETFSVPNERRKCSLDIAKYLIIAHMNRPILNPEASENGYKMIVNRLVKLRRNYDVDGYAGLVDLDTEHGTPRSIVHIAKALARAYGKSVVDEIMMEEALDYFIESRRSMFELWEDRDIKFDSHVHEHNARYLSSSAKRILRFILDHPNSIRAEIRENFPKISDSIFEQSLQTLVKTGYIYRTSELDEKYSAV